MGVEKMRDRMERFTVLPFSMGCVSHASVNVAEQRPRKSRSDFKSPSLRNQDEEDDDESLSAESMKHSSRFLALPKPHISTGVNKLVKGFKSLSQLFIYEDEMEELGMEMEIGCPTDVKHVTHIGWDGSASANPIMGWHNLISPELLGHHHLHHSSAAPLGHFPQPSAAPENKTPAFASAFTASSPTTA